MYDPDLVSNKAGQHKTINRCGKRYAGDCKQANEISPSFHSYYSILRLPTLSITRGNMVLTGHGRPPVEM
jgi:hypothetical protein